MEDLESTDVKEDPKKKQALEKATKAIAGQLDGKHQLLSGGACSALGEIGRVMPLLLPNKSEDKKVTSKHSVVQNLITKVKQTNENPKVREKAALSAGYMCVGDRKFPHTKAVIDGLLDSAQPKQVELHFTVGEALVYAALGPSSDAARDVWTVTKEEFLQKQAPADDEVGHLVSLLLEKYAISPNPHVRQVSFAIWKYFCVRLFSLF